MTISLTRTLALRFAVTMAVALLGIALWAYLGMRRTLIAQLDLALRATFEHQSIALAQTGRLLSAPPGVDAQGFVRQVNRLIVLWDSTGRVVQTNVPHARDLVLDTSRLDSALMGRQVVATGPWGETDARSLYGPAPSASPGHVLQVAASLEPMNDASNGVLGRMIATAMLGSLASLVGAGWLTRSALTPVTEIASQAARIHGGSAGQRITVHVEVAELRGLIDILNQMLERLERAAEWHRQIIRDLGHDLRTPITTMRASVEMGLWGQRTVEDHRRILSELHDDIERLVMIGDAMTTLGRLESGDLSPDLSVADVRSVVAQAVERARSYKDGENVRLAAGPDPGSATLDPRLIGLALDQLLDNVRRHTPAGTAVNVAAGADDGRVVITVEDHGPGVPEEFRSQLFSRFFRGDSARGRQAGTGLGLALAAAIVDLHHGRISAEPGATGGLRIRIELPASRDYRAAVHAISPSPVNRSMS